MKTLTAAIVALCCIGLSGVAQAQFFPPDDVPRAWQVYPDGNGGTFWQREPYEQVYVENLGRQERSYVLPYDRYDRYEGRWENYQGNE